VRKSLLEKFLVLLHSVEYIRSRWERARPEVLRAQDAGWVASLDSSAFGRVTRPLTRERSKAGTWSSPLVRLRLDLRGAIFFFSLSPRADSVKNATPPAASNQGLSLGDVLETVRERGLEVSEATFRKYVQLGLLPRSVRVGTKGKHRGSLGLYPPSTVERIVLIKRLLAENFTIEEIKNEFLFLRNELDEIEARLDKIFSELGNFVRERYGTNHILGLDLGRAQSDAESLIVRLEKLRDGIVAAKNRRTPMPARVVGY
jgi:DNA-binding transcriptional MerR regulator